MRFFVLSVPAALLFPFATLAETQSLVEARFVDIRAENIHKVNDPQFLNALISEAGGKNTATAVLSTTSRGPARIRGVIEWIYPTEHDPTETPNLVGGNIHPGGLPKTTVTPTAFETRSIGTDLEVDWHQTTDIAASLTDCLGLENSALPTGDPIAYPRFYSRGATVKDLSLATPGRWQVLASQQTPHDEELITLTCVRPLSAPEEFNLSYDADGRTIHSLVESFEIDPEAIDPFISSIDGSTDHSTSRAFVDQLLKSGQARTLDVQWISASTGEMMKQSSAQEYQYPTEMDPPELPNEIYGDFYDGSDLATGVSPTAFETRYCGTEIVIQFKSAANVGLIETDFSYDSVQLDILHQTGSGLGKVHFPFFRTIGCQTRTFSQSGKPHLAAVITPPLRTSHIGKEKTSSALDAPAYQTTGVPRVAIFITASTPKTSE